MVGEELVALFIKLMRSGSQEEPGSIELDHVTKPFDQLGTFVPNKDTSSSGTPSTAVNITAAGTLEYFVLDSSNSTRVTITVDGVVMLNNRIMANLVVYPFVVQFNTSLVISFTPGAGGGGTIYTGHRLS